METALVARYGAMVEVEEVARAMPQIEGCCSRIGEGWPASPIIRDYEVHKAD
jgi:hypothetical protein